MVLRGLRGLQTSYRKQFDCRRRQFVYVLASNERAGVIHYDSKPSSLFDSDVPLPADEWEPIVDPATGSVLHYSNSYRGLSSRFNNEQVNAAHCVPFTWVHGPRV